MIFCPRFLGLIVRFVRGLYPVVHVNTILILLCVAVSGDAVISQEVIKFRDKLSESNYNHLLQKEKAAVEETDRNQRAKLLSELALEANVYNHQLSVNLYDIAIEFIRDVPNDSLLAYTLAWATMPSIRMGEFELADSLIDEAMAYYQGQEDSMGIALCFLQYAFLERSRSRYYTALDYLYKARAYHEVEFSLHEMWDITNRTMINYELLGDYDSAIELGEEFVQAARSQDELPYGYYLVVRNLAEAYFKNGNIPIAKEYMAESLPRWIGTGSPKYITESYSLMFDVAMAENEIELAKNYSDSLLAYAPRLNSARLESFAHLSQYRINKKQDIHDKQEYHIHEAYQKAIEANHDVSILDAAEHYSEYAYSIENLEMAYDKRVLADSLRKQIYSKEISSKLDDLERQLLLQKSQNEIVLLDQQNRSKEESLKKERNLRWVLMGLLVAALVGVGIIMSFLKQRSKHNKLLSEKNDIISQSLAQKDTLIAEVHHRVKNNLQIVSSLLNLQSDHIENKSALEAINSGKQRVGAIALVHKFLYQNENIRTVFAKEYFEELSRILLEAYEIPSKKISIKTDIDTMRLDVDTMIPLGLIVHELLVNSIKYAFQDRQQGQINLGLKQINTNRLSLFVRDNGAGIHTELSEALNSSFGWQLINTLSSQLRGQLTVSNNNGVEVKLELPFEPIQ